MSLLSQAVIADSTLLSVKDMKEVKNIGHRFSVQNNFKGYGNNSRGCRSFSGSSSCSKQISGIAKYAF